MTARLSRKAEIIALLAAGVPHREIAARTGRALGTVRGYASTTGYTQRPVLIDADELRALAATGVQTKALAEHFGVTFTAIRQAARRRGIAIATRARISPEAWEPIDPEAVAYLVSEGWGQKRIARHFRCPESQIRRVMRGHGIAPIHASPFRRPRRTDVPGVNAGASSATGAPGLDHPSLVPLVTETISRADPAQSSF